MTQPWFKFSGAAWCGDRALRSCSIGARGFWLEMMIVMDQAIPRGSLLVNGRQIDSKKLAGVVGVDRKQAEELLAELEDAGVFSRDGDGTIFSRKMRRDEARAERDKRSGEMGGHPEIRRGTVPKDERVRRFRKSDAPEKAQRIYDRDGGNCHWCGKPLGTAYHIDHVVAIRDGGGNGEENLVAACPDCNGRRAMTWGPTPTQYAVGKDRAVMVGNNSDPSSDLKAKNLELRSQKEAALLSAEAASERDEKPETLEQKCRKIVGEEPVSIDHNFVILGDLVGKDGIVEDDVIDGILAAMEDRSFRIKYWKQLIGWARTAARKRLSDAAKRVSPTTIALAGVEEPAVDLGLGLTAESMVVKIIEKHAQAPYAHWIETQFGDTKTFRRRVEERASHLMKFWPEEPLRAAQ